MNFLIFVVVFLLFSLLIHFYKFSFKTISATNICFFNLRCKYFCNLLITLRINRVKNTVLMMQYKILKACFFGFFLILVSCVSVPEEKELTEVVELEEKEKMDTLKENALLEEVEVISALEQKMMDAGLVDVQSVDSSLWTDVKYATEDNFMGTVLYEGYDKVYLQEEVAERLSKAQAALQKKDANLSLLVFDGTRPRSVQQQIWDALDSLPFS